MYQPQAQDFTKPELEHKFKVLSKLGFTQIIVQWSSYGEYVFTTKHSQWFETLFALAKKYNIDIYMGLYADPKYFQEVQKTTFDANVYLAYLLKKNKKMITSIHNSFKNKVMFKGWYIYDELNDVVWQKKANQKALARYLADIEIFLKKKNTKNVYISAYFTGSMPPKTYVSFLHDVIPTRWEVLVQTGVGAGLVSIEICQKYFTQFKATFERKWMPIIEIFSFKDKKIQKDFSMYLVQKPCMGKRYAFFSWRYLFEKSFLIQYLEE